MLGNRARVREEADLDITPFMNLMIVLVPVLLLSMVFTRITTIQIQLPEAAASSASELKKQQVEVRTERSFTPVVNFPAGVKLRSVPDTDEGVPNYAELSLVLQSLKQELRSRNADRDNLTLLVQPDTAYAQIISTLDAVRSYQAVVATDVVDARLFPEVAFADAPAGKRG